MELTFLTEEQIFGDDKLDIISKYGTKCAITDFAILLGGVVSSNFYTSEGNTLKDRNGCWWTKTPYNDDAHVVNTYGHSYWNFVNCRHSGSRPALSYSSIRSISMKGVRDNFGIKEVEYGEYPQWVASENISRELERAYNNGNLRTTGKSYTTDSVFYQDTDISFRARTHTEYIYNGSKYIRFLSDSNCNKQVLSDGRTIELLTPYWIAVEPITWLVDEKTDIALSKKIIFSGVQFKNLRDYKGDFENTNIYNFMNTYLIKEIINNSVVTNDDNSNKEYPEISKRMEDIKKRI